MLGISSIRTDVYLFIYFIFGSFWRFIHPSRKIRVARAALPIAKQCMWYFPVSKQRYGRQLLGFLTCSQMLMLAAHEGCTDTVRESALEMDSGRKIPRRTGESNLPQRRADPTLYQLSYIPAPCSCER